MAVNSRFWWWHGCGGDACSGRREARWSWKHNGVQRGAKYRTKYLTWSFSCASNFQPAPVGFVRFLQEISAVFFDFAVVSVRDLGFRDCMRLVSIIRLISHQAYDLSFGKSMIWYDDQIAWMTGKEQHVNSVTRYFYVFFFFFFLQSFFCRFSRVPVNSRT